MSAAEAQSSRPRPLLLVALALILAIAGWRYLPSFGGGPGFTRTTSADLRSAAIEVVELAAYTLDHAPPEGRTKRDPWSFGSRPAPVTSTPEPEAEALPEPEPIRLNVPEEKPTPPPPMPIGPKPPPVDVVYLGSFGRDDNPIAVFKDNDAVYNALVGDLVKKKFKVQRIGYESVDLQFVGFPEEPAVRLAIGGRLDGS